jgi:hypothetical protein
MECLLAKNSLPSTGTGAIDQRRSAISDTLVNYLIVMMLEAMEWNKSDPIVIPSSLIVLLRERLCGEMPDLRQAYLSRQEKDHAAFLAAEHFRLGDTISVRKLAKLAGVSKSTADRWLADPEFQRSLTLHRKFLAGEGPLGPVQSDRAGNTHKPSET